MRPQSLSSFLATDEIDSPRSPLHSALDDDPSCDGAVALCTSAIKDPNRARACPLSQDGSGSNCSMGWSDEFLSSEPSLSGPRLNSAIFQNLDKETSGGNLDNRNQDVDLLLSEEDETILCHHERNAMRTSICERTVHYPENFLEGDDELWQQTESVLSSSDPLLWSDPQSIYTNFSLSCTTLTQSGQSSTFGADDWEMRQCTDDLIVCSGSAHSLYSDGEDYVQDEVISGSDAATIPSTPLASSILYSDADTPQNIKNVQETPRDLTDQGPECTPHARNIPALEPSYMLTVPRPREWVLEKLEELASQLLNDLSYRKTPTVALSARAQAQSIVYDHRDGIIRRKANQPTQCNNCSRKYRQESTGVRSSNARKRKLEVAELYDYRGIERWVQLSSVSRMHQLAAPYDELSNYTDLSSKQSYVQSTESTGYTSQGRVRDRECDYEGRESVYAPGPFMRTSRLSNPGGWHSIRSIVRIADLIHGNISQSVLSTKRDLYYKDSATFRSQNLVDRLVEDVACTLQVPRSTLNVVAGTRGLMFGSIRLLVRTPYRQQNIAEAVQEADEEKYPERVNEDPEWLQCDLQQRAKQQHEMGGHCEVPESTVSQSVQEQYGSADYSPERPLDDHDTGKIFNGTAKRCVLTEYNTLVTLPANTDDILRVELHPQTKTILVVEKEATMNHLISIGFYESPIGGPCVLLTSKGYPDVATRSLLKRLQDMVQAGVYILDVSPVSSIEMTRPRSAFDPKASAEIKIPLPIPILALVDCDPHGIEIFLTYKCGSIQSAYDNANLATPALRCLGQVPSDWEVFFKIKPSSLRADHSTGTQPRSESSLTREGCEKEQSLLPVDSYLHEQFQQSMLPLSTRERVKLIRLLMAHPFVRHSLEWRRQISKMLMLNRKTELQSLCVGIPEVDARIDPSRMENKATLAKSLKECGGDVEREGFPLKGLNRYTMTLYLEQKLLDPQSWI